MADESVIIEVRDGVDKNVARNLSEISSQARSAYQNVDKLVRQLNRVKPTAIAQFNSVVTNAQKQMSNAAMAAQRLATEQQRTATASANAASAQQRAAVAAANVERAQSQAAAAALRLEAAQDRSAAAAGRQAAAQAKAAAAASAASARLAAQEIEVARVNGIHDRFNNVLARNPKYATAFAANTAAIGKAAKLTRHELINLSYQANDVAMSLATGQRPMQVFLQQGAQIGQIFGASGVGLAAIFKQLGAIVGRFLLKLAPFGLIVSAVLAPFALFTREFNKGIDSKKLVDGLKLTEDQLKALEKSGEKTRITFGDTFKATFQVIGRYAANFLKPVTDAISRWWGTSLDNITDFISLFVRAGLGLFIGFGRAVVAAWSNIPASIELVFKKAFNAAIDIVEKALNFMSSAIMSSPIAKLLGLDGAVEFKLPRFELSDSAKDMGAQIQQAFDEGFSKADSIVDKFSGDVRAQALANAQARLRAAAGEDTGAGKKKGFDRAKELAAINAQLDSQAKNMFVLATARDAANRVDEIAIRFAKEKQPLSQKEIETLRNKIQALNDAKEIQQQFDRIFSAVTGPQREYNASLAAANKLLEMGVITQARYNAELARAGKAYRDAVDPAQQMIDNVREELRLLGFAAPLRAKEQQLEQARNAYRSAGIPINEKAIEQLGREIDLLQQKSIQMQIIDDLQANSAAQRSINTQQRTSNAVGQIGVNGFTGLDAVSQLAQDNPALQATQEFTQSQVAAYQDMYAQIEELRQKDVISDSSAMMAKFALFQQQSQMYLDTASGILGNLAQLRNSDNKKAAALGKKAAIAQALMNTYTGATAAFQSAAAIPFVGWVLAPIAAAAAIAAGMAQVQAIRSQGYQQGGYTGNIPVDQVAGAVHGREFVMDAATTSRVGVADLEALRSGAARVQRRGDAASAGVAAANGGGAGPAAAPVVVPAPSIRLINVSSEQEARNFASSDENEQIILNVLQKNGVF